MKTKKKDGNKTKIFSYNGYEIPVDLVNLTGGGIDTWDEISKSHKAQHVKYSPILPDHNVLEIGCGVGRDAIQLAELLSEEANYIGIDIIRPSIEWCQENITKEHPNFKFYYLDIESQIHNPTGNNKTTEVKLPLESNSIDRIILHSVFTHMFKVDIIHYLKESKRILKPGGTVFASFFILDNEALSLIKNETKNQSGTVNLTFRYNYGEGCFINDKDYPEGAVGYLPEAFEEILKKSGMKLSQSIHYGYWSGRKGISDGQDIVILEPIKRSLFFKKIRRKIESFFTI